ncbi:MAG: DUF4244 domain-containing protein [Acidimicrobiales bacterium]
MLSRIVLAQRARLRPPGWVARKLRSPRVAPARSDAGQTTTEYALVTLGAAAVALLVTAWAGRTGKIGQLLDAVVDRVIGGM